jgi:recombination protein RecR
VVETWHDLCAIERSGGYHGDYHVLGGALCPLEGVGPDDLTVEVLVGRIGPIHKEVVLAMNQTPEGEATATYVVRSLRDKEILITRLAQGVPAGGSLEYTDRLTLCKALSERKVY